MQSKYLTLTEAAKVLGISRQMMHILVSKRKIRPKPRLVVSRSEAERMAKRLKARWTAAGGKPGSLQKAVREGIRGGEASAGQV